MVYVEVLQNSRIDHNRKLTEHYDAISCYFFVIALLYVFHSSAIYANATYFIA